MLKQSPEQKVREFAAFLSGVEGRFVFPYVKCFKQAQIYGVALSSHLSICPYRRYVDNINLQTTGEEMTDRFHHTMNSLHPKLKFEIEKPETTPNGLSLSLNAIEGQHSKISEYNEYMYTWYMHCLMHHSHQSLNTFYKGV